MRKLPVGLELRARKTGEVAVSQAPPKRLLHLSLAIWLLFCSKATCFAQPSERQRPAPVAGLLSDRAVALNTATRKVYAVDTRRGEVVVIDPVTQAHKRLSVGNAPVAIAINSVANRVYVANNGSSSITVIDGATDAVSAAIPVGKTPYILAVNEVTNRVYVSNTFSDIVSVIDGQTNQVHKLKAGSANRILVDSDRDLIYLLGYEDDSLSVIDGKTEEIRRVPAGALHLWDVALDQRTGDTYVARIGYGDLVRPGNHARSIAAGAMPCAVRIDTQRRRGYVANYASDNVTIFDLVKQTTVADVPVGERPEAIAIDEEANLVYVANTLSSSVSVIDGIEEKVVATLPAGKNPYALTLDERDGALYAAGLGDDTVAHLDVRALRLAALSRHLAGR